MLSNLGNGKSEDGRKMNLGVEDQTDSIELWGQRRRRIIYSMANCAISQKARKNIFTKIADDQCDQMLG